MTWEIIMAEGRVYLAGPITNCTYGECTDWRKYAQAKLAEADIKGVSPMRGKDYLEGLGKLSGTGEEYAHLGVMSLPRGVMTRDRWDCTRCDAVLVNFLGAEKVSIGTVMECAWADLSRRPIICVIEKGQTPLFDTTWRPWLAALIDGEGCIHISRRPGAYSPWYGALVRIKMTSEEMIRTVHQRVGLGGVSAPKPLSSGRTAWEWTVMGNEAAAVLAEVFPFLIVKRAQAALAIEMQSLNINGGKRKPTDENIAARASVFERQRAAQAGQIVEFTAPPPPVSVHNHMMLWESWGYRVETLDAALDLIKAMFS